jgi:3-oxoacyl-[acyl-carrier protein] reductase
MSNADSRPVALITGASLGIGRASALELARRGYDLLLTSRDQAALETVAGETAAVGAQLHIATEAADLTVPADRQRLYDRAAALGDQLSVVVHCAAAQVDPEAEATLAATSQQRVQETFDATLASAAELLAALSHQLSSSGGGRVFFMSSDWALPGSAGPPVFSAAKAGLLHLCRSAREHYAKQGVLLTVLVLGDVATYDEEWEKPIWSLDDPVERVEERHGQARIPLRDVIDAITFVLERKLARVDEIYLMPLLPES